MSRAERVRIVAVVGPGACGPELAESAREVGRLLAKRGCAVLTGGLGGVMEAASRGAAEVGGLVIGILPTAEASDANAYVAVAIATGLGEARNAVVASTAEALVAVGGAGDSFGTLSEIAFALRRGKRVVSLGSWAIDPSIRMARTPEEAVDLALGPREAAG